MLENIIDKLRIFFNIPNVYQIYYTSSTSKTPQFIGLEYSFAEAMKVVGYFHENDELSENAAFTLNKPNETQYRIEIFKNDDVRVYASPIFISKEK